MLGNQWLLSSHRERQKDHHCLPFLSISLPFAWNDTVSWNLYGSHVHILKVCLEERFGLTITAPLVNFRNTCQYVNQPVNNLLRYLLNCPEGNDKSNFISKIISYKYFNYMYDWIKFITHLIIVKLRKLWSLMNIFQGPLWV